MVSFVMRVKDMRGDGLVSFAVPPLSQCHLTAHIDALIMDVSATTLRRPHVCSQILSEGKHTFPKDTVACVFYELLQCAEGF